MRRLLRLALRRRERWEREVQDEIATHLGLRAEQLVRQGRSPEDARAEAIRRFGGGPLDESTARLLDAARHRERRMQRAEWLADLRQDVGFALRTLGRQKGWTTVVIATLALGIGATTAVFSVVSSLLLHAVPYPEADRIVVIYQQPSDGNNTGINVTITPSARAVRAWREGSRSFEALEGYRSSPMKLGGGSEDGPMLNSGIVFPSFPSFAGERTLIGRWFTSGDIISGDRVVVLGEGIWRTRFGGSDAVVGTSIILNDTSHTVIGVAPASLRPPRVGLGARDVWLPLDERNDALGMALFGRLRPGIDIQTVTAELDSLFARSGGFTEGQAPFVSKVMRPAERLHFRDSLLLLTVAVGLVLLIACVNVAHLLIARGVTRQRELAMRVALGAGRGRLFRQLLTECAMLATAGTAIGIALGWAGLRTLIALRPPTLSELQAARLDSTTLTVAIALALGSAVVFGLLSALQSARRSTVDDLKAGALSTSHSRRTGRIRALLVVSEMALSATLLVGAALLVRSVVHLQRSDLGFVPRGLYSVWLQLPDSRYPSAASRAAVLDEITARLRGQPGVTSLSLAAVAPGSRSFSIGRLEVEGQPPPPSSASSFIDVNQVDPGFFGTMRIPLVQGTSFSDTGVAARQVIVNAGFARRQWANMSPLGRRIRVAQQGDEPWLTIVGVAADASTTGPASESSAPMLYTPFRPDEGFPSVMLRVAESSGALAPSVRELVHSVDARASPAIASVEETMQRAIATPRFVMLLLTVFTALALLLAGIGLYGLMAYTVAQRTREIGIRVALGATASRIARGVVTRAVALAAIGAALGCIAAFWATRLIEEQLYGVTRLDPLSFAAGILVLAATAVLACVVPARRAVRVDPVIAMRAE